MFYKQYRCKMLSDSCWECEVLLLGVRHVMEESQNANYTVLVVDDDKDLNNTLRDALSGVGFNVLTNNSGLKGLETLRSGSKNVDVVLLDYSMPTVDGSRTLEFLNDQFPKVKAIGITGFATAELPDDYRNKVEKLLTKPIMITDLVAAIHSVLGISAKTKAAARNTYWMTLSAWCSLFVVCGYGLFRLFGLLLNEALTLK
jgi:DNA-binding NtrC family response regulator